METENFKEELLYSYSECCFYNFEKESQTLFHAIAANKNRFEKIVYRIDNHGIKIVGLYSDADTIRREKEQERAEYAILRDEFEPDPEDHTETVEIPKVITIKNVSANLFKRLFGGT